MIQFVESQSVAPAVGPYCHATVFDALIFCSGSVGMDTKARLVSGDIAEQSHQALRNLAQVLQDAGTGLDLVLKTTVFLTDMKHYSAMNEAYTEVFGAHRPARSCIAVAALPLGALVEVEAIAALKR